MTGKNRRIWKPLIETLAGCLGFILLLPFSGSCQAQHNKVPDSRAVPEALVYADADINSHDGSRFAVVVDKSRQQINLFGWDGYWRMISKYPCSTGKLPGPKATEGDKRTPEGVYFAIRNVGPRYLTDTYGSRALPLDYPNWLDKQQARNGSAIWLHGTNKDLQARESNGCVVLDNSTIERLASFISLNRTPVIIVDRLRLWALKNARQAADIILAAVDQWHDALMHGNYNDFRIYYVGQAAPSMRWWQRWCRTRRNEGLKSSFKSYMMSRAIYKRDDDYVLLFDHVLKSGSRNLLVGRRKLYLKLNGDTVQIFGDTYQTVPHSRREPLIQAWRMIRMTADANNQMAANGKKGQAIFSLE